VRDKSDLPKEFSGKKLLLICNSGITSGFAAESLAKIPGVEASNVQGGMQAFGAGREMNCPACMIGPQKAEEGAIDLCRANEPRPTNGRPENQAKIPAQRIIHHANINKLLPFRETSLFEQWVAVLTGFAVKPTYTLLSLIYAVFLWSAKSPDLVALRRAMIAFFIGENFCAANYLLFQDGSYLLEYLHIFGMLLCFGLVVYAALEAIDRRIIAYSEKDKPCAALELCRGCMKYKDSPCGFQRVFLWLLPALAVVSFMPLTAGLISVSYNTRILGTLYNYSHAVIHQLYEIRFLPIAAILLFVASWCFLRFGKREPVAWAKAFFAAGIGAISFSFFRMILLHAYSEDLVWFAAWEEITELLFILGVGLLLLIFRHGLKE
jgi:hypothetical protein